MPPKAATSSTSRIRVAYLVLVENHSADRIETFANQAVGRPGREDRVCIKWAGKLWLRDAAERIQTSLGIRGAIKVLAQGKRLGEGLDG
jgi:hypothetical protein